MMSKFTADFKISFKTTAILLLLTTMSFAVASCMSGSQGNSDEGGATKNIQLNIKDIRGKTITYDIYQVTNDELEYVATQVADRDGNTQVEVEVDNKVNNVIIKRTKDGVEKRQVVPLRGSKVDVQFLL